jgi:hypothetical protein
LRNLREKSAKTKVYTPQLHAQITEKDEEVLAYLADVTCADLEPGVDEQGDPVEGFKLTFAFAPNPFFDNAELARFLLPPLLPLLCPCVA